MTLPATTPLAPSVTIPNVTGMPILEAALAYAEAGFWLVPTHPRDIKNPGSVLGKTWQRGSSRDPEQLRAWFGADRGYGIALHCGPSGICAFDLDNPANIPPDLLMAIGRHNPPHQATRIDTRGRGHYIFSVSPNTPPSSSATGLGPDWGDVRSGNTVIILAPTPHPKENGCYAWRSTGPVPPLPPELVAKLGAAPARRGDNASAADLERELADDAAPGPELTKILDGYLEQTSSGLCRHDTMRATQLSLVGAAAQGGRGLRAALDQLRDTFETQIGDDPSRAGEFERTLTGAYQIIAAERTQGLIEIPTSVRNASGSASAAPLDQPEDRRPVIMVDGNRLTVINNLLGAMLDRWNGHTLFNYGGGITELAGHSLKVLQSADFPMKIAQTARTLTRKPNGDKDDAWPDTNTMMALRTAASHYAELKRVIRTPFLRSDGSVCSTSGYDPASQTVLVLDPTVNWPTIPDAPTGDQVRGAIWTLQEDWLGDMPFETQADRANALGTALTPFIRGLVPLSPMAVIDGTQMGVGKNLLADCISLLVCGTMALPMPYTRDDDETRKAITSAFRSGTDLMVFDEAHTITGAALARALTSITYTDRLLGVSQMLEFPNQVTWLALGNNVSVLGDVIRRVYRIRLAPAGANPENRPNDQFNHPDLRGWTSQHRARLIGACLTLIRAWFAGGCPEQPHSASMGSFEPWERMIGGILHLAGVPGFLTNTTEWRAEADYQSQYWANHLGWLAETFPDQQPFSSAQVKAALLTRDNPAFGGLEEVTPPPPLMDPEQKDYSFQLGRAYARVLGRDFGGHKIARPPSATNTGISRTGGTSRWVVL